MQVREPRMDDNRASAADNLRKISPSCVGGEKFFLHCCLVRKIQFSSLSLHSANENYYYSDCGSSGKPKNACVLNLGLNFSHRQTQKMFHFVCFLQLTSGAHAWSPAGLLFAKSSSLVGTVHRDCHASWRVTKQVRPA